MLELMYASGLRVSELVQLKTVHVGMNEGVLRVMGKGARNAWCPLATKRTRLAHALPRRGAPAILGGQATTTCS
jgi:integrase/recombinase XerD